MSPSTTTARRPWAVPLAALALVGAAVAVPQVTRDADAAAALPEKTAAQLLADVSTAEVAGLSGTVVQTSRLGLPELAETGPPGASPVSLTALLSGSTTARVWYAGEDRQRVAVSGDFAEYDVVRDGTDLWTYDSTTGEVTHVLLPGEPARPGEPEPELPEGVTPEGAASTVLAMVDDTTEVTVGRAETVAGRPAYELVLTPRDEVSLVQSVRLAVDGETSVPLRVRVYGEGQAEPAVEVGFTSVTFAVPDAPVFAFVPPPGAPVEEVDLTDHAAALGPGGHRSPHGPGDGLERPGDATGPRPTVTGSGWTSVVTLPGTVPTESLGVLAPLAQPVEGGRAVTSTLLSVLLLDDGRTLVGPVPVDVLLATAAQG